ncbi:alpha-2-macroglobulin family protein [Pelagicoccus sp. SDUM812002]|uniref:alpha-2-macroglobulin family protein n=1 Tax=Pelagicoccus sp. SDUM812002 TaxID=3041266 RepID=UPI00280FAB7B|nr:alpha-2-macroglobulin family protein [Pelagicoccus sp. SDUM812002]MDQ8187058.1 alpha-2-macroglobulin family protein [Pelagicoccus sp. SDUM812002]
MDTSLRPFLILGALLALACNLHAAPRDDLWLKVAEAEAQRLPKTAIEALEPIIEAALADGSHAEAIKAISKKIALETQIQGELPEESILRLQAELEQTPPELRPVFQTLLAHSYWSYFQQNRWRFLQRTQTAESPSEDFRTWDLTRILREIDRHFTAALANKEFLQSIPIEDYDAFLTRGTAPDAYRPTLYDFLAHEALSFYQSGEQAAIEAEVSFEISANSPIFDGPQAFLDWQLESSGSYSPELKAVQLFQEILHFHEDDSDRSAFFDADLARLTYGYNVALGEDKDQRYSDALSEFIERTARHEISTRAIANLATYHHAQNEFQIAHQIARQGLETFPESVGSVECYNLLQQIEQKSASIQTEHVWNAPWPTIDVTYRNVERIYFRAIRGDFESDLASSQPKDLSDKTLRAQEPTYAWQEDLPSTPDFQERTQKLTAPTNLQPGYYYILASHDPSFSVLDNQLSSATVWVSNLALILRTQETDTPLAGFVLKARSGDPIEGAKVQVWRQNRNQRFRKSLNLTTDANGYFQLPSHLDRERTIIVASYQHQTIANSQAIWPYQNDRGTGSNNYTAFFTDRAIYRPGQTISFKGIAIQTHASQNQYQTQPNRKITIALRDANRRVVSEQSHRTNDYGSFSGSFTAPSDGLLGQMSIEVIDGSRGSTYFNVEEYKRPKFQVTLNPPENAPKLGEEVSLTGKATAYTGASIGGTKVKWRVERGVQAPLWCWWWIPPATKAIAHGSVTTESDGSFSIHFPATPDKSVPRENEPIFTYTVYADVTDTNGETRSASTSTRAAYTALQAQLSAAEWLTEDSPVEIAISTQSLDGTPQAAKVSLKVFRLQQPETIERKPLEYNSYNHWGYRLSEPKYDPSNPATWENASTVSKKNIKIDSSGKATYSAKLSAGPYRVELQSKDRFGNPVTARHTFTVQAPDVPHHATKIPNFLGAPSLNLEPGERLDALWATGYPQGRAFIEIERNGETLESYWTDGEQSQERIQFPITEDYRGGLTLRTTFVHENRAYFETRRVTVPWTNKQLQVKWERFRSKLEPGRAETWTATITGPDAQTAAAEIVATLYDASLDQYRPHNWPNYLGNFYNEYPSVSSQFSNTQQSFNLFLSDWAPNMRSVSWSYRSLPYWINRQYGFRDLARYQRYSGGAEETFELSPFALDAAGDEGYTATSTLAGSRLNTSMKDVASPMSTNALELSHDPALPPPPAPDLSQVSARKNLNETAFFYPHLLSDEDGVVKIQFTMPEALTKWRFFGFAHDNELRSGFLSDTAVTAKDLMVEPNPPRFLREGDEVEFTVKVSNQSETEQNGQVRLTFSAAATLESADVSLQNLDTDKSFTIPAKESRSYSWRIKVPDGAGVLTYKAVGASDSLSDGEEGYLPVLSKRILVTESLPLSIRGKGSKEFDFDKLLASADSDSLQHQNLTVQMVSQPAWYAVMALPYLMEYPFECSEQLFNRFYANELASHIANSDPKIRRVFDLWKNTEALDSPLEKNQELKSVLIEETPWLRQAKNESQARRNVGILFDQNRLQNESSNALRKLAERQLDDGRWSWFPGGYASDYITLYIATGFGRMRHLGAEIDMEPAIRSLDALDHWMQESYRDIQEWSQPEDYVPGHLISLYLYGRSFFLQEKPVAKEHRQALDFFLERAREHWTRVSSRQSEAHLALALQRFGDRDTPAAIVKSLKERSVSDEELGMFWRDTEYNSWWWYHAPIETQALMVEAFAEVAEDAQAVEDLKVWLLKQKQTQNWKTTKATADAVYGLLLRGQNLLASDALVAVKLGSQTIEPEDVEAGTGFYQKSFVRQEIQPEMGNITVTKTDDGVSWGSVHWQYLEDMSKVTPHEATPLTLKKTLFVKENSASGPVLKPIDGPLSVGDELVVRLELRSDRDMEYLHLKDQRGSGTEPVNVLSGHRYQDRLGYYESTRDTASHFFIHYLPKGTYVFEYSTRVQLKGSYQSGIAEIQCMYAPEFNSHSQSVLLAVE